MTTPAGSDQLIRDLATQMAQMTKLGFDPMTVRKGVIAAIDDAVTPPTVSINISGDTQTLVSAVRTMNNYTPLVGQTVLLAKQGSEIWLLGSIASINPRTAVASTPTDNGWVKPTLSNGTHGGSEGDIYYRRIMDHGSWKMQWRGIWNVSGTAMISSGQALDPDYRPASFKPISVGRNSDGLSTVRMDFGADGTVSLVTGVPRIPSTTISFGGSTDVRLSGYNSQAGTDLGHSHGWSDSGSHSHGGFTEVPSPSWVSLNGVEYFL